MEPVTHILTGACLARTGLNRRAAYTALAMSVGAEFPDIDTLWGLRGPVEAFRHHRGITHTFVGVPVEAAAIVVLIYAWHRWRTRATASGTKHPLTTVPPNWGMLYLFTVLALLSHLFLDWTNNYGLRPFFPFNPHWYAASITFIFDPLMFVLLLGALVLPPIFRLVSSEVGARRQPFAARGWSVAALCGVIVLWAFRAVQHNKALALAQSQTLTYTRRVDTDAAAPHHPPLDTDAPAPEQPTVLLQAQRALASPDPISPFRWWTVTDFGPVTQMGQADTGRETIVPAQQTEPKPMPGPALRAAEASPLGRAYMDWSPMPFITVARVSQSEAEDVQSPSAATIVVFRDPRFLGDIRGMRGRTPLEGRVVLDAQGRMLQESMDGKVQH